MRFHAVTLDAFGTVLDTGCEAVFEVAADAVARERLPTTPEAFLAAWDRAFFTLQREIHSPDRPFLTLAQSSERSLATALAGFECEAEPQAYIARLLDRWRTAKPFPDATAALESLRDLPLAIVSNADDAFLRELLERCDIDVDLVVTSEAARSYKPNRGIFEVALRALGTNPAQTLHVGDSYLEDVAGSKAAGMGAAWLNRRGLPRPRDAPIADVEVRDLLAVPSFLGVARRNR